MRICVIGGAGFVGSMLVPKLRDLGHVVNVLDTYWYDRDDISGCDMRNATDCREAFQDRDAIIHLACVSNDPSFELNPLFGASVNGPETMRTVLRAAQACGVKRFIYASSSSVYGVQPQNKIVDENCACEPLTDYSRFKLACERVLQESDLNWTILRPATVCGWSPRLRLDVVVNAMTASALRTGFIEVHGGDQMRANIHIADMVEAYVRCLEEPKSTHKIYNVGAENLSLREIAEEVASVIPSDIVVQKSKDPRSYRIASGRIASDLDFMPMLTVRDAVKSIREKLWHGQHTINIERMRSLLDAGAI